MSDQYAPSEAFIRHVKPHMRARKQSGSVKHSMYTLKEFFRARRLDKMPKNTTRDNTPTDKAITVHAHHMPLNVASEGAASK